MYNQRQSILNRPLTPHLTIYSSQFTSIYSIWHRISGLVLLLVLVIFFVNLKFNVYFHAKIKLNLDIALWIFNTLFLIFTLFFLYHMLNGLRHIIWDLGYNLSVKKIINSSKYLILFLIGYILFLLYKIIN